MQSVTRNTEFRRFMAALYMPDVRFSYLPGFATDVRRRIATEATKVEDLVGILSSTESILEDKTIIHDNGLARRYVEASDIKRIKGSIADHGLLAENSSTEEIRNDIVDACTQAARILDRYNVPVDDVPEIFIVDQIPAPYNNRTDAAALAVCSHDEAEFGIRPGIYFEESSILPYYSSFIALHEMLHIVLGRQDPSRIAHGLEEGLSDVLGSIWLSCAILGRDLTRRLFILNRLSSEYNPFWERYLDTGRQVYSLILTKGLDGILDLLRNGRATLYKAERELFHMQRDQVRANLNDDFMSLAWELLFTYPRAFVCSPAAFIFAQSVRSGLTVREVAAHARLSPELATAACHELRDQHAAILLRKDEIVVIEGEPANIFAQTWFRYQSHRQ